MTMRLLKALRDIGYLRQTSTLAYPTVGIWAQSCAPRRYQTTEIEYVIQISNEKYRQSISGQFNPLLNLLKQNICGGGEATTCKKENGKKF